MRDVQSCHFHQAFVCGHWGFHGSIPQRHFAFWQVNTDFFLVKLRKICPERKAALYNL